MKQLWRLLDTGPRSAAQNMALEWILPTARNRGLIPNTIHFLEFSPHCALLGYHQSLELEVDLEYCRRHGIEVNRRVSGGGAIYMDEGQLGWEIIARKGTPGIPGRLENMYQLLCESAIAGLSKLGVTARYRPINDIEVDGRKISGSGGTELEDSFIFHGSLLTNFDVDTMIQCLKLPVKKLEDKQIQSFKQRVVCLKEILGSLPPMPVIKQAMADGFAETLGIELQPGGLTKEEKEMLDQELPRFQSKEWIWGERADTQGSSLNVSDHKSPGGLIRVSALMDYSRRRIKSLFITGDFFAYPERAILDLEAALRNTPSDPAHLRENVYRFFAAHEVRIPGAGPEDFYQAVLAAVVSEQENKQ